MGLKTVDGNGEANHESAVRAAETALELDPELAEGHAALGLMLLGDTEIKLERAERSLRRALDLDPSLTNAYNWLSNALPRQGRHEEANAVQERGLLVNPLDPILSLNKARPITKPGRTRTRRATSPASDQSARASRAGLQRAVSAIHRMGEFDKALRWAKQSAAGYCQVQSHTVGSLAGTYDRLGLIEDSDYWLADLLAHTPQPEHRFWIRATQLRMRGDHAGLQEVIDELDAAPGTDIDQLHIADAGLYASANILVENFDVGIEVFENAYDLGSLTLGDDVSFFGDLEYLHVLAYGYQQVGRDDDANALLIRLHEHLNVLVVEQKMNSGDLHLLRAQNFGLRGDFDAAADALEAAYQGRLVVVFLGYGQPSLDGNDCLSSYRRHAR